MTLKSHITGENLQPHLFILRYYETLGSDDPYIIILTLHSFTCTCLPPKFSNNFVTFICILNLGKHCYCKAHNVISELITPTDN